MTSVTKGKYPEFSHIISSDSDSDIIKAPSKFEASNPLNQLLYPSYTFYILVV
jgi:hypothetical protein